MADFSQAEINNLISCPKQVTDPPKREMRLEKGHWRNDAKLVASNDLKVEFAVFLRINEDFPENFSIGLRYNDHGGAGELTLLRCNGKHGESNNSFDPDHPHVEFHIHRASSEAIKNGLAPEKHAAKTTEYASYDEALQYFLRLVNVDINDSKKHFPSKSQSQFDFEQ